MFKNHKIYKSKSKGFSLVELIIVMAIIGILAAIAVPMYGKYVKEGKNATAQASASAINNAVVRTLFEKHEEVIDVNALTQDYATILQQAKLESTQTLEFRYYSTNADLPTKANFTQLANTWVVYIPQTTNQNNQNVFDFTRDVVVYTPSEYEFARFDNGLPVE